MANLTQTKLNHFVFETQGQLLKLFENELVFGKYSNVNTLLLNYYKF